MQNHTIPTVSKSSKLYDRAVKVIPEQTMTLAKSAIQFPEGFPLYVQSGQGCELTDVDGNTYIDYTMSLGAILLGYGYPSVLNAVKKQLDEGSIFSLPHPIEVEVAERLVDAWTFADQVRFYKNGADVCGIAVRLARSFTGKKTILFTGYHGHQEWFAFTLRDAGTLDEIKPYTKKVAYNSLEAVKEAVDQSGNDVAAIMVENAFDLPDPTYLKELKKYCEQNNIILIFDEMWTGFRFGIGGYQEYADVKADLGLFSKAIANGFPVSVIGGRHDIMQHFNKVWGFTTFGGETLSLAALNQTLKECQEKPVQNYIWTLGQYLKSGIEQSIIKYDKGSEIEIKGYPCRFTMNYKKNESENKKRLQSTLLKHGILWNNLCVLSFSHTKEQIEKSLLAFDEAIKNL